MPGFTMILAGNEDWRASGDLAVAIGNVAQKAAARL